MEEFNSNQINMLSNLLNISPYSNIVSNIFESDMDPSIVFPSAFGQRHRQPFLPPCQNLTASRLSKRFSSHGLSDTLDKRLRPDDQNQITPQIMNQPINIIPSSDVTVPTIIVAPRHLSREELDQVVKSTQSPQPSRQTQGFLCRPFPSTPIKAL